MKLLIYIAGFNIAGIILSFLYGITGGSGGETTEGVFMGIGFTGVITLFACMLLFLLKKEIRSKWYLVILLGLIGAFEASIINWSFV